MPHVKPPEGYLSVTQVLDLVIHKHFLYFWAGKNGLATCERIKRESQEIGTAVHLGIENLLQTGNPQTEDTKVLDMVQSFHTNFVLPFEVKAVSLEITLQDPKLKLQGTYDALAYTNKGLCICDWKTSSSIDKITVPLQLSMYSYLNSIAEKQAGLEGTDKGVVVRIDKESHKVEIKWYEDLRKYDKIWKSGLRLARFIKFGIGEDK